MTNIGLLNSIPYSLRPNSNTPVFMGNELDPKNSLLSLSFMNSHSQNLNQSIQTNIITLLNHTHQGSTSHSPTSTVQTNNITLATPTSGTQLIPTSAPNTGALLTSEKTPRRTKRKITEKDPVSFHPETNPVNSSSPKKESKRKKPQKQEKKKIPSRRNSPRSKKPRPEDIPTTLPSPAPKTEEKEEFEGEEEFEVYTGADGEERVRMSSLLEPGQSLHDLLGIPKTRVKNAQEEGEDIDIEEAGDKFGKPQYDADKSLEELLVEFDNSEALPEEETELQEIESALVDSSVEGKVNDKQIIEALTARIRSLESQVATSAFKCLICLDTYSTPLVSINCWHVHCEKCWLLSLSSKKLCPQCRMITLPTELRRIYL